LWVVRSFKVVRDHPSYPHNVELTPYYQGRSQRILAEMSFRQSMQVWEDAIEFSIQTNEKFIDASRNDPTSPFRGKPTSAQDAQRFFGIDCHGNRTD
jgi:hypothetical protein